MSFTIPSSLQSSFKTNSDFKIPYVGPISGGLREDMALYLQGVPTNADEFGVKFKTSSDEWRDISFDFKDPLKGQAFEMFTVIKSEGYQVYINGKELHTFDHCRPLEKVLELKIYGDVAMNLFGFINNWSTSSSTIQ
ncbi:galectin-4-like [Megalobrama amblycephala]|uniref:galectin-4-like n=1 Tax=Megalobrama amblycephala TaxID=75352 RepID=UPI002013C83A|nr:galectin-4-like [Megalobrama amblycephala]